MIKMMNDIYDMPNISLTYIIFIKEYRSMDITLLKYICYIFVG